MSGNVFLLVFTFISISEVYSFHPGFTNRRRALDHVEYDDYILVCNQNPIDLTFIIDASASIWKVNFTIGLEFVQDFIEMYDIGPDMVRISTVTFGRGVYRQGSFTFSRFQNKQEVLAAVSNIRYPAGLWTGTGDAINYFVKKQFPDARPNVPHLCIVLTDGNSQEHRKTKEAAAKARALNVTMFAIGVGSERKVKDSELLSIAGDESRMFRTSSYAELDSVKEQLAFQTCYKKPKPTTPPAAQPCGMEFPADMHFVYDIAALGADGNSFVSQFASHTFEEDGMGEGMRLAVSSALCPDEDGFAMGAYPNLSDMRNRMDKLYQPSRLGDIVQKKLALGFATENGGRPNGSAKKIAVIFLGPKIDLEHLANEIEAANANLGGDLIVFFSDMGGGASSVATLSQRFNTIPLTGGSREQSAILHSAICGPMRI